MEAEEETVGSVNTLLSRIGDEENYQLRATSGEKNVTMMLLSAADSMTTWNS